MQRRTKFGLAALVVVVAIILTAGFASWLITQARVAKAFQEAIGILLEENNRLGDNASDPKLPKVEMHSSAALDGDITTLTIRHQNQTKGMVIDLVINKASLGKLAPKDKLDFPIRIGRLAPGATHEIALRYENVPWKLVGDDSAEVNLSYAEEWSGTIKGSPRKIEVRGVTFDLKGDLESKQNDHSTIEGPVRLDAAGAQALKKRREAGLKEGKSNEIEK
jgi:hypothetical protein